MVPLPVTRFAPSPTGLLHLGNARTALFSWLYARHAGGRFVLRVEDTDAARSTEASVTALVDDLAWLGLDYDAGPGREDPLGPYRQSARAALYASRFAELVGRERAYHCFCSATTLELARKRQIARGEPPRYAGGCDRLSPAEVQWRLAANEPASLRFRVPASQTIRYEDLVRGAQSFDSATLGDFVIRRADGSASFLASNAIDDAAMGITDVLRGEDHVANTPRQILLLEALDLAPPRYGHLPLLVGADGAPLSKRHGAASVSDLRDEGYLAEAVLNLLFRLGHTPAAEGWHTDAERRAGFRADHLGRAPARFDLDQLRHWQQEAVHRADHGTLSAFVPALVPAAESDAFLAAVRANVILPADALRYATIVYGDLPEAPPAVLAAISDGGAALYAAAAAALDAGADWPALTGAVRAATGRSGKALYRPLRAALTHALDGPELGPLLALMGPRRARARFSAAGALCAASVA